MKRLLSLATLCAVVLSFSSCQKDVVADGSLSYSFQATNLSASVGTTGTASGAVVAAGTAGSITWTAASVNISKVLFSATKAGTAFTLEAKNLNNINALKPDSLSGTLPLVSGTYENIVLKLSLVQSVSAPPMVLTGTYTESSGTKIPIIVQLNQTLDIPLTADKIEVAATTYVGKVKVELNNLVKGLTANDFGQTIRNGNTNTIVVNSTTNVALFAKLTANLASTVTSVSFVKL